MNNLRDLEIGNTYYIIDDYDCYPVITEIKVVGRKKGIRIVENIRHIKDGEELKEDFYFHKYINYEECRFMDISRKDLQHMVISNNKKDLLSILEQCIREREEDLSCELDYTPPEEYPDWDGDESIMYYLDNYVEEYDRDYEEDN